MNEGIKKPAQIKWYDISSKSSETSTYVARVPGGILIREELNEDFSVVFIPCTAEEFTGWVETLKT